MLTDKGRESIACGVEALAQLQESLLSALTRAQLTGLEDCLSALQERLVEIGNN